MAQLVKKATIIENSPAVLFRTVRLSSGVLAVQADLDEINIKVFDVSTRNQVGDTIVLAVASVFYDTLQTGDIRWDDDEEDGYNFAYEVAGTYFPKGGRKYAVEVQFVPVSGNPFLSLYELTTTNSHYYDTEPDAVVEDDA